MPQNYGVSKKSKNLIFYWKHGKATLIGLLLSHWFKVTKVGAPEPTNQPTNQS